MQDSNDGSYIEDSHDDDIFGAVMIDHICRAVMIDQSKEPWVHWKNLSAAKNNRSCLE